MTPHKGEFKQISGIDLPVGDNNLSERIKIVNEITQKLNTVMLVKGAVDIIANTKKGIYVAQVGGGGEVDVITGNFMMGVAEAYLIENGKITNPVKGASLSGMGIKALKTIDMVGDDLFIFPGAGQCGKGQTVLTGFGMPTVRVRGILVGGPGESWEDADGGAK